MWLFLLLPLLVSLSIAEDGTRLSTLRVATADVFRLKCDSLNYRSYVEGSICYFAYIGTVKHEHGDLACRSAMAGAQMYVEAARERVLRGMMLEPSSFHDFSTASDQKSVLCTYQTQFSCDQGDLGLPGKCITRSPKPVTWPEASNFCRSQGASSVVIHNDDENTIMTGYLEKDETGWLLPSRETLWSAEKEKIDFWSWIGDDLTNLKCSDDSQHAVISRNGKETCSAYGTWTVDYSKNKNIALCIKDASCPFCPPVKAADPETIVTLPPLEPETTTTPAPCYPLNDPPEQKDLSHLMYYYNWGRILHAFAANAAGLNTIMRNGIGYDRSRGAGSMGGALTDEGYKRLPEFCSDPEERKHIVQMWFKKTGLSYHHTFTPAEVYVGYVARKGGACGSKWPVKRWSCLVSADMMYAGNLNGNTWYRGRQQNGGAIHFWLWEMNEGVRNKQRKGKPATCLPPAPTKPPGTCKPKNDPPKQNDLWDLRYYYNWGRILHAFASTPEGVNKIMSNGIGYDRNSGAGSLGGAISDDGYTRLEQYCSDPEERKHIVKMWFTKTGLSYHHTFTPAEIYVGYVARKANACGSKWPVKRWSCLVSADMMYAGNLNSNTWYRGRQQNGGVVHFWLWEMNEAEREKQRKGAEC